MLGREIRESFRDVEIFYIMTWVVSRGIFIY